MRLQNAVLLFFLLTTGVVPAYAEAFTVVDWSLGTGIEFPEYPNGVAEYSLDPINPFVEQHDVSWKQSTAMSDFAFAWDESLGTGDFLVEGQHVAQAPGQSTAVKASSSGAIIFDVSEDLIVNIEASYTYFLPTDGMTAGVGFKITDAQAGGETLYDDSKGVTSFPVWPLSGTLAFSDQILLPGGQEWRFIYSMGASAGTFAPLGALASGEGFVHWSLTPVCEPTTAILALPATMLLLRRKRRHPVAR